jgi:hypothetical protein
MAVRTLISYRMVTDNLYYNQDQHFWTPGVLKDYDIPDLPIMIAPRPVAFMAPVDHMTQPVAEADWQKRFSGARAAYAAEGRPGGLVMAQGSGLKSCCRSIVEWLDLQRGASAR